MNLLCSLGRVPLPSLAFAVAAALILCPAPANAQIPGLPALSGDEEEEIAAQEEVIQNRKYDLTNELSILGGGFFEDPYYKGFTGSVAYTVHLSDFWAWEVVNGTYSFNVATSLQDEVQRVAFAQGQEVPTFPEITWVGSSRLVLKPLYGKEALFNTEVIHIEAFLAAGPSILSRQDGASSIAIGGNVGGGFRFWISEVTAIRLDVAQLFYLEGDDFETDFFVSAGFSFNLRSDD